MTIRDEKLDQLIDQALKKIDGQKESDVCRYIPVETGGYIHHFTFRKMKAESPEELSKMIAQFVLSPYQPKPVPPKRRASRRRKRDQFLFNQADLDRMLNIARLAGDKEMVMKLTPKKELSQLKRELIGSIRREEIDQELWNQYTEAITNRMQTTMEEATVGSV